MKRMMLPIIAIVLLLSANNTIAQTAQTSKGLNVQNTKAGGAVKENTPAASSKQMSADQMQQRKAEAATRMGKSLETKMSLSADQKHKIYEANLNYVNEIESHRSGSVLTQAAHDKYVAERDAKIKKALTADQYTKYAAMNRTNGAVSHSNNQ